MKRIHLFALNSLRPIIAAAELLLVFPAVLFMVSLFARNLQPTQYQPAHAAEQIVAWFAASPRVGLWILLIALPFTVLTTGGLVLLKNWRRDAELRRVARETLAAIRGHLATLCVAAATLSAGTILAIVALHLMTD